MVDVNARRKMCTLVAAAFIDGHLADEERAMIFRKGLDMKLPENMINDIIELGRKGSLAISVPPTLKQKEDLLDNLIDIACADGKLAKEENHLLLKFSRQLGLSVHDLGKRVKQRLSSRRPEPTPRDVIEDGIVILQEEPTRQLNDPEPTPEKAAKKVSPPPKSKKAPPPRREIPNIGRRSQPTYAGSPNSPGVQLRKPKEMRPPLPPGPVQLNGPQLGRSRHDNEIGIVSEQLIKQILMYSKDTQAHLEAVNYLKDRLKIETDERCQQIIQNVMERNPDIVLGKYHVEPKSYHAHP